jgi:putative ABC transport system permease protein
MDGLELVKLAFEAISERKLRSGLTILMVLVGSALMTTLNGMNAGTSAYVNEQFSRFAANVLIVSPSPFRGPAGAGGAGITFNDQTVNTIKSIAGVKEVVPFFSDSVEISAGGRSRRINLIGIDQSKILSIYPGLQLEEGSFLAKHDSIGIVLGYEVAHPPALSAPFATFGQSVLVRYSKVETSGNVQKTVTESRGFQVKGVLAAYGTQTDRVAYISLSAANSLFKKSGKYDGMYVVTVDPSVNDAVEKRIRDRYSGNIGVISPRAIAQNIQSLLAGISTYIQSIAIVSLVVGAVGIVTTLYTSVTERIKEIGLLKALGFSNSSILFLFLDEAIIIGLIGGTIGIAAGVVFANLGLGAMPMFRFGGAAAGMKPIFYPQDLASVWGLSILLSIIAGLYPAWRASGLEPVVALRKE